MNAHRLPRRRHPALSACSVAILMALAGCQSYSPQPLDPAAQRAEYLSRSPSSPEVVQFAAQLQASRNPDSSFNPADGLTQAEAEVVSLVYNGDLRRARARAGVMAASAAHAGLWEDPVLGTDLVRILESTSNPWKVFSVVNLTIPISGRLELEKQRAGAEHAAALVRVYQSEWETRIAVRREWAAWTAAVRRRDVLRDLMTQLGEVVGVVDRIERAGELARVEAGLFRLEHAQRATDLVQAEASVAEGEQQLRRLLGLPSSAAISFLPSELGGDEQPAAAAFTEKAEAQSPALALARAEYEASERSLELEIRKQYPDLQIGPGYGSEDGMNQLLLNFSLPLPVLNANQQGIAVAHAEREQARVEYETAAESLAADLELALMRMNAAKNRADALERTLAPLVEQQYEDARRIAKMGEVNTLLLLETLTRQQDAKLSLISAYLDLRLAAIEVAALAGPSPAAQAAPSNEEARP